MPGLGQRFPAGLQRRAPSPCQGRWELSVLLFDFRYPLTEKIPEDKICSESRNTLKWVCILVITEPSEHF